jgi:DNA replication and repair protein RecF
MKINYLELYNFRNILSAQLNFGENFNIIFGNNGAGKTSLLEAIYVLSMGRSFRSQYQQSAITHQHDKFLLFAKIKDDANTEIPIGMERFIDGRGHLRLAEEKISTHIPITKLIPVQLITTKDYRLIEAGSEYRRQFLDWGVFHVEHSFLSHWQKMRLAIKQRNALLKAKSSEQLQYWNQQLEESGAILDKLRSNYIESFIPLFNTLIERLLGKDVYISLEYYAGWNTRISLKETLSVNLNKDMHLGFTSAGPHRADIKLKIDAYSIQDVLSRGQQKILLYSLRLAQGILLKQQKHINCVYLIDDLPSELDNEKSKEIIRLLSDMNVQTFITGINHDIFEIISSKKREIFHVKHGEIGPVVI